MEDNQITTSSTTIGIHGFLVSDPAQRVSGFSLLEVLISIVVLSFGLLGMVGMQAAALKSNREARLQSTAVVLARELAEMMRGNKIEAIKSTSNPYLGAFTKATPTTPLAATTSTFCLSVGTTACTTTTEIAEAEMTEWIARVDDQLPGARIAVCFDSAPFDANGLPQWACSGTGDEIVVKIGWTRGSTNKSTSGSSALERATVPSVVLPVTPGSST